jgi:hypothetical protein
MAMNIRTGRAMDKGELRRAWEEIQTKIRPVLMEDWDPIGVSDVGLAPIDRNGYQRLIARLRSLDLPRFVYPRNLDGG